MLISQFLLLSADSLTLAIHLSQGGRIDFEERSRPTRPRGAVARFSFDRPPSLLLKEFGTERKAGWWVLAEGDPGPMAKLGPEPFSEEFASVIPKCFSLDRRRIRERAQQRFSAERMAQDYQRVYEQLIGHC